MKTIIESAQPRYAEIARKLPIGLLLTLTSLVAQAQSDPIPPPNDNPGDPLPNDICAEKSTKGHLPNIGLDFVYSKFLDCKTRTIKSVVTDSNGNVIDLNEAFQDDLKARMANPKAKVDRDLWLALKEDPKKRVRVMVWLALDTAPLDNYAIGFLEPLAPTLGEPPKFNEQIVLDIEDQVLAFNRAQITQLTQGFAKLVGNRTIFIGEYAPVVAVWANRREVRLMAKRPEVDSLYLESNSGELNREGFIAHRVLPEWANSVFGLGRRVAVLEQDPIENGRYLEV